MIFPAIGRSRRMMVFRRLNVKTRCSAGANLEIAATPAGILIPPKRFS
jgi:hypothetical protein